MNSTAVDKRAQRPRKADYSRQFDKDWERLNRSGRYDMRRLKELMWRLIAGDFPLEAHWRDHPLEGDWAGFRECHVGGDFLLIYWLDATGQKIEFVRAGSHADLFE
jgi:mRNA interferase YafQ